MSNESDADVVAALWAEYKSTGAVEARERLILNYAPLVKFVAGRVAAGLPHSVEQADLVLFVVDASFFPASASVNPALTIAAQALRVADHIRSTHFRQAPAVALDAARA